jgi:hypothetical protein
MGLVRCTGTAKAPGRSVKEGLALTWRWVRFAADHVPNRDRARTAPCPRAASRRPFETRIGALHDIGYNLGGGYGS